jgi:hypothetical protein
VIPDSNKNCFNFIWNRACPAGVEGFARSTACLRLSKYNGTLYLEPNETVAPKHSGDVPA